MTPTEAAHLLVVRLPTTLEEIAAAFRRQVVRHHPDVRSNPAGAIPMDDLREARDVLVNVTRGVKPACNVCGSTGVVMTRGFKPVACPKGCKFKPLTYPAPRRKS